MKTTVLLMMSVMAFLGTAPALGASTLVVDKDKAQCPDAQFQSIQAAVVAAMPGDTILVCPDLYIESVTVPKTLAIRAAGNPGSSGDARLQCFDTTAASPDPTQEAIVQGGTFAFHLLQNDITLEGLTIQGALHGIQTSPLFSGYAISNNVIQSNSFGILLASSDQTEIVIERNCFRNNGEGMRTEAGFLANVAIAQNRFFQNFLGMLVQDGALTRASSTTSR
jgi:parallel beta-helix repeat protein